MKTYIIVYIVMLIVFFGSCNINDNKRAAKKAKTNEVTDVNVLDSVFKRKKIIAATDYGSLSYLIYRGEPIGYKYELLKDFTNSIGVDLQLVIESNISEAIEKLNRGEIDLLAMGLTVTTERKKNLLFSDPIMTTRQVLVQRKPEGYEKMGTLDEIESHLIKNPLLLANKEIYVQEGTIFYDRLKTLSNEIADTIYIINDERDVEDLIEAVALGEIDYTISDEHIAIVNSRYYRNLDVKTTISFPQKISWAAEKSQKPLIDTINSWLKTFNKSLKSRLLYNKYFKNVRSKRIVNSKYNSYKGSNLSPYDEEILSAAKIIGWDWRFLASLVYQESEFKPNVVSWAGAFGLMQLMPSVVEKYNLDTLATPEQQLTAGVDHLLYIKKQLPNDITDSIEQVKFLLASYNCGLGHVLDARRLAVKLGKDPNIWTNNVDSCILKLSEKKYYKDPVVYNGYVRGKETFNFVNEIFYRYDIYRELID